MGYIKEELKKQKKIYKIMLNLLYYAQKIETTYAYKERLKREFKKYLGYTLNLDNPQSFNEKLQWLKTYYRNPIMAQCADKQGVRKIIIKEIGAQYLVPQYGVYNSSKEIRLEQLPDSFVLKPSHSSGRVILCHDKRKMDWPETFEKLDDWLKENYYYQSGEWVYKDIKPRIICEKFLTGEMIDYKFMCFFGEPKLLFTCSDRECGDLKVTFFDMEFKKLPFIRKYPSSDTIKKPYFFNEMIEISKKLSKKFPFVRVDFYENQGKLYFGELTFFPGGGFEWFSPVEWDYKLGAMLDLKKIDSMYIKR